MEAGNASSASGWSQLLEEILHQILTRLALPDCIRFGQVCRSWRSVRNQYRPPPLLIKLRHVLPDYDDMFASEKISQKWFETKVYAADDIFAPISDNEKRFLSNLELGFFHLIHSKFQKLPLKLRLCNGDKIQPCYGRHSQGWLTVNGDSYLEKWDPLHDWYGVNYLMNLTSGERIDLPPIKGHMKTAALSSSPTSDDCMLICYGNFILDNRWCNAWAFCCIGDEKWTIFDKSPTPRYTSIAFHNDEIYMLSKNYDTIVYGTFDRSHPVMSGLIDRAFEGSPSYINVETQFFEGGEDLLLVAMFHKSMSTREFQVFKLESRSWVRITSLGDRVLLRSHRAACSFCTNEVVGSEFRGNCIYWVEETTINYLWVYSMDDGSCRTIVRAADGSDWFMPQEWCMRAAEVLTMWE